MRTLLAWAMGAGILVAGLGCGAGDGSGGGGGSGGAGGNGGGASTSETGTETSICNQLGELGPEECRKTEDCTNSSATCAPAGSPSCGGAGCGLDPCGVDSDCPAGEVPSVCEIEACCGDKRCVSGCNVDEDCAEGGMCTADFHCVPKTCSDGVCPANFDCAMGATPTCQRRGCSCDSDCDGGHCVSGGCYTAFGTCELPKP